MNASAVPAPMTALAASASDGSGAISRTPLQSASTPRPGGADAAGPEPVAQPAGGELHQHVAQEQHRREQPDHGQPHAVGGRQIVRDCAHVGDVPPGREADGAARSDRSAAHRQAEQAMIAAVTRAPAIGRLY